MRKIFLLKGILLLLSFIFSIPSFSSSLSDYLDEIIFANFQLEAVTIDMERFLGWYFEDKELIEEGSQKALKDLEEIESYVRKINFPQELRDLKNQFLDLVNKLKEIYKGIEKKKVEEIKNEFTAFQNLYAQFSKNFQKVSPHREPPKLSRDFQLIDEEVKSAKSEEDKKLYIKAKNLMKRRQFKKPMRFLPGLKISIKIHLSQIALC